MKTLKVSWKIFKIVWKFVAFILNNKNLKELGEDIAHLWKGTTTGK